MRRHEGVLPMLTVFTNHRGRTCDGTSRRDFLRIGGLTLGGLALGDRLAWQAIAAEQKIHFLRDKAVVFLYLSGGASHIETFDPKMDAAADVRSMTGDVATKLPGVRFGGTFPGLAARANQLAIVRSFQHPVGDHEDAHVHVLTGGTDPTGKGGKGFSIGSAATRLRGVNDPKTGLPTYVLIGENEVDGQYSSEFRRVQLGSTPGILGNSLGPLVHKTVEAKAESKSTRKNSPVPSSLAADMQLQLPAERFADRRLLLSQLDQWKRRIEGVEALGGIDKFNEQAANLVLGGAADAFDFRQESQAVRERYDTSDIQIGHKVFRPSTLGQQLLVARRLCEAGCGFVTVHSAGWDMHADGNNPGIIAGMDMLGRSVDRAVSAFLDDLAARGMSDKVLLVITGDFGRTPKVNKNAGRDHWSKLCTLALAGGGLKMGQIIGQSTKNADAPATEPYNCSHLMATIVHTLFDVGQLRLVSSVPRELAKQIEQHRPIAELF